jgi:ferric-dicitrate binding protein FerR (iron transport regulator)
MINRETENLIAKYLTGEASAQEKSEFKLWLNSNDQNKEEFRQIALTFQLSKSQSETNRKAQVFSKIKQRIDADFEKSITTDRNKNNSLLKRWVSIAATILVIALVGMSYFASTDINNVDEVHASIVHKSNPAGQKSKVFLPDGSIAWLNSESSISYESEFKDSSRHIHLTGEAFFEVKKDSIRPFVVYSGAISTTALGTSFNINAFNESNITVSLTTGKVNVETTNL